MPKTMRNKIASRAFRLLPSRIARRFVRRQDGAAAVEFAFIAAPFLALLFAILETALVFFAGQTLEAATADASRLILTGQAQTTNFKTGLADANGFSKADFKDAICQRIIAMFDCNGSIYVNVQSYNTFDAIDTSPPPLKTDGSFDASKMGYSPGGPGAIVIVQVFYQWPIYASVLDMLSQGQAPGIGANRLLMATAVFRNEPFVPVTPPPS